MPAAVRLTLIETNLFQTKHPAEGRLAERLLFLKQKSLLSMQTTSSFFLHHHQAAALLFHAFHRAKKTCDPKITGLSGSPRQVFADSAALQAARLDPPHVTQLCTRLGYDGVFLTVEEFLDACDCQA